MPQELISNPSQPGSSTTSKPRVSVIIVTYRSTHELPACIDSLMLQNVPLEIFLVDNASPDATPQMVLDYAARNSNIHAILNNENIGLAAANNCPLGQCRGEYILILNPDTVLPENCLAQLENYLNAHTDVGIVGPKNLYEDGSPLLSYNRAWGFWQIIVWRILPNRIPRVLWDRYSSYKNQDVLVVSGSCLLIRTAIFEQIRGYDPEYFLTYDDVVDLCIRTRNAGHRVVFLGDVEMYHLLGRSGAQVPFIGVWEGNRCTVYHFLKHKGLISALLIAGILILACSFRMAIAGLLYPFSKRYRNVFRVYAKVVWYMFVKTPLLARNRYFKTLSSST
ncbi:glycosyltransferase family 2 protein [Terriglobus albidus]|uniref:Glycosyltransferase family 2 protein n=1 Tax=Terriglobus albidus TaxID=1592106 RepID=A0A5B9E8F1_9BACT|nr:glycosyltransferase family 2 protein [Terriglobus albidus]QEE28388.1 glycosyltransferase family 2 protein [Terriglobus albidus]